MGEYKNFSDILMWLIQAYFPIKVKRPHCKFKKIAQYVSDYSCDLFLIRLN